MPLDVAPQKSQLTALERYYRLHARIYDLTRWTFLRGRKVLSAQVASCLAPQRILEVGCGTGTNLLSLGRLFPQASLWGLDLSADMLAVAAKKLREFGPRLRLIQAPYDRPLAPASPFDLVLFSYALSMFNPGWDQALKVAHLDLSPCGSIAIVDFHDSASKAFKKWMGLNHVRLDGHLLPHLVSLFPVHRGSVHPVYNGLWSYFCFLGHNPQARHGDHLGLRIMQPRFQPRRPRTLTRVVACFSVSGSGHP